MVASFEWEWELRPSQDFHFGPGTVTVYTRAELLLFAQNSEKEPAAQNQANDAATPTQCSSASAVGPAPYAAGRGW